MSGSDSDNINSNLYVVTGQYNDVFYFFDEALAKKHLFDLTLGSLTQAPEAQRCVFEEDRNDGDQSISMDVFSKKGKLAHLSHVSTTTLDMTKLSKLPPEDVMKIIDLVSIVEVTNAPPKGRV